MLDSVSPTLTLHYGLQPSEIRGMTPRLIWSYVDLMVTRLREVGERVP